MDSEHLAQGLRKTDPTVINYIYHGPLGNSIRKMVQRYGGNVFDAENILTPTIMKAIELVQRGVYEEKGKCEAFLKAVAGMMWRDERKKKGPGIWKRSIQVEIDENFLPILSNEMPEDPLEESIRAAEERKYLLAQVESLDPKCRELIKLRYLEGYQLNEIEEIMQLSKNYPNVLNGRCLDKLKKIIDPSKLDR